MRKGASYRRRDAWDGALYLLSAFFVFGFNSTLTTALPGYVGFLGGDAFLGSLQNSLFILAAVVLRFVFAPLADRWGSRTLLVLGALGFCLPCPLLAICDSYWQVLALRLVQAIGLAAYHPNAAAVVSGIAAQGRCGMWLGLLRFVTTASFMVGPALLFPLIARAGYGAFFFAMTLAAFVGLLLLLPTKGGRRAAGGAASGAAADAAPAGDAAPVGARERHAALRRLWPLLALTFVLACGYGVIVNFGARLSSELSAGSNSGLTFTFMSAGGLAGSLVAGRAFDAWGARRVVPGCVACAAAGFAVFASAGAAACGFAAIAGGAGLAGFGYYGGIAALNAGVATGAGICRGYLLSMQQNCLDIGIACGGLLGGAILTLGGNTTQLFGMSGIVLAACATLWLLAGRLRSDADA